MNNINYHCAKNTELSQGKDTDTSHSENEYPENAVLYGFATDRDDDLNAEAIISKAIAILENRRLDKLAQKLVAKGDAPESLDDFQLFLRSGFLGIDSQTRDKLIERNRAKRAITI